MQHESASDVRRDLARRITERAMRMRENSPPIIVPAAGEPAHGRSALDQKLREIERLKTMALAEESPALRRVRNNGKFFQQAPRASRHRVAREIVSELVEEGALKWIDRAHTAAALPERTKGEVAS